jgi:molybdate transport system ATP-binding protein
VSGGLAVDVRMRRGTFWLDATVEVGSGEVLAVLGPNGSGKSTLLAVIAGLLEPDRGTVRWRGRELTSGSRSVPPAERRIGLLGQDPLLFPHLSALDNVAFGPRARGVAGADRVASEWLDRFDVGHLAQRRPRQLSGGEAARVALARTLAAEPELVLLDEPLAALDAAAAPSLRQLIASTIRDLGLTTVLVSHDVLDAALLADRVAVLREGTVVEQGPRAEVLSAPRTAFTAALVGVNLVPAGFGGLRTADGATATQLRFRPAAVELASLPRWRENTWEAQVRWPEPATGGVRLRLTTPQPSDAPDVLADVDPAAVDEAWLDPGARVWAHVPADAVSGV